MDDLPVGVIDNGVLSYIQPDHLGTPRNIVDPNTNVTIWDWPIVDNPFGELAPNQDPDGDSTDFVFNLRFPGQYFDAETGLHYNYFRDYEPGTARYVESDPIGLRGGASTFGYVGASPLARVDSRGLEAGGMYNYDYHPEYRMAPPSMECKIGFGVNTGFDEFGLNTRDGFTHDQTVLPDFGGGISLCCKPIDQCSNGSGASPSPNTPYLSGLPYTDVSFGGRRNGMSFSSDGTICISYGRGVGSPFNFGHTAPPWPTYYNPYSYP